MTKERITRQEAINLLATQLRNTDSRDGYKTESIDFYQVEAQSRLADEIKYETSYAGQYYIWKEGRYHYKQLFGV